jgi:hypothetical protein
MEKKDLRTIQQFPHAHLCDSGSGSPINSIATSTASSQVKEEVRGDLKKKMLMEE